MQDIDFDDENEAYSFITKEYVDIATKIIIDSIEDGFDQVMISYATLLHDVIGSIHYKHKIGDEADYILQKVISIKEIILNKNI